MASFEPSSVYGNRVAWQELLLVTANDTKNVFHRSSLWRQGLVNDIVMLPRSEMVKPPRSDAKYGSDGRFTRVQEMKQAPVLLLGLVGFTNYGMMFKTKPPSPP